MLGSQLSDPSCTIGLASWYTTGHVSNNVFVIPKDERKAFELVLSVANSINHEYPRGDFTLAYFYEHGIGTPKSHESALKYYTKAANSGFLLFILGYSRAAERLKNLTPPDHKINRGFSAYVSRIFTRK